MQSTPAKATPIAHNFFWLNMQAALFSLALLSSLIYVVIGFLFPDDPLRFILILGTVAYSITEVMLLKIKRIRSIIRVVDQNLPSGLEISLLFGFAVLWAALTKIWFSSASLALLFVTWIFLFFTQSFLTYIIAYRIDGMLRKRMKLNWQQVIQPLPLWIAGLVILAAMIMFYAPMQIGPSEEKTYGNAWAYFAATRGYADLGVLFAVAVEPSYQSPEGYGRFEHLNNSDDVGYVLIQALAQRLGRAPNTTSNLVINRMVFIVGALLFALSAGIFVFHSPIAFLAIGGALFVSHGYFSSIIYQLADHHGAQVGLTLVGLSFIILIPYILKKTSLSTIVITLFISGLTFGMIGLVRQSTGLPFLATSLLIILISWLIHRKSRAVLTLAALLAVLLGHTAASELKVTLFAYRDLKLNIHLVPEAPGEHGIYLSLLGGVTEWNDGYLHRVIADENPLVLPTTNTTRVGSETKFYSTFNPGVFVISRQLFLQQVFDQPKQFIRSNLRDAGEILRLTLDIAGRDWIKSLLFLGLIIGVGKSIEYSWHRIVKYPTQAKIDPDIVNEVVIGLMILSLVTAAIPVLTYISFTFLQDTLITVFALMTIVAARIMFDIKLTSETDLPA